MTLKCPVCGHAARFERSAKEADLYRCPNCDHCFSDPASLAIPEDEVYRPPYYGKNWFLNPNRRLFDRIGRIAVRSRPDGSLVDVGCGKGAFLQAMRERFPALRMAGIDITENNPCDGIEFYRADALTIDPPRQFDVVVSLALIEHLADVTKFVTQLKRLCAPGGVIVVMTCNDRSVLYGTARLLARMGFRRPLDQLYGRHHVNHFNKRSIRALMESSGIGVEQTLLHNIPMAAIDIAHQSSPVGRAVLTAGVWGTFVLGKLVGRTFLQTLICRNPVSPVA